MAVSPVFLASLVTVLPAMGVLWYFLRRYEGFFQDSKIFFALTAGLFAGLLAAAFEFFTNFGSDEFSASVGFVSAFLYFVVGYAFFETGIKAVILGLGRFRGQRDTPYYGVSLGMGIGAMLAMMIIANALRIGETNGTPYGWGTGIAMALIPAGAMFTHGATGSWVGLGSAEGKLWKGWGIGTLIQMPTLLLFWFWWPSIGNGTAPILAGIATSVVSPVYGLSMLWLAQRRVLDKVVPADVQDRVRKEIRRAARAEMATSSHDEEE